MGYGSVRTLLVTGGAGFIGSNFLRYWLERYPQDRLICVDLFTYASNHTIRQLSDQYNQLDLIEGSICSEQTIQQIMQNSIINMIVNFAAETHVDRSIDEPMLFTQTNLVGTQVLIEAARQYCEKNSDQKTPLRFHQVSTDEVYGSIAAQQAGAKEQSPYKPSSPYAASKAAADMLVKAYNRTYGLDVTISNGSNTYGPYQYPDKLIPKTIVNVLTDQRIPIYGDGSQMRDWLYVNDHVLSIESILLGGRAGESYNVAANQELSNLQLVTKICAVIERLLERHRDFRMVFSGAKHALVGDSRKLIEFVGDRPGHDMRYDVDCTKIASELGFSVASVFDQTLEDTVLWYMNNYQWWSDEQSVKKPS